MIPGTQMEKADWKRLSWISFRSRRRVLGIRSNFSNVQVKKGLIIKADR